MTEPQNKDGGGVVGAVGALSAQLIRILPPAFVLLILMNIVFLGLITWVVDHNADIRNELLTKIVEKCLLTPTQRQ